jgi:bud site selection protein 31
MREAEEEPHEGKRKPESVWPILRIHHQMSRYIYDLYKTKTISKGIHNTFRI